MDYEKIKNNQKKYVIYTDAKIKLNREYLFSQLCKYWEWVTAEPVKCYLWR